MAIDCGWGSVVERHLAKVNVARSNRVTRFQLKPLRVKNSKGFSVFRVHFSVCRFTLHSCGQIEQTNRLISQFEYCPLKLSYPLAKKYKTQLHNSLDIH